MIVTLLALAMTGHLHPAFTIKTADALKAWETGWEAAPRKRDTNYILNRYKRGIGKIRTSILAQKTVSWLYYFPPEAIAFHYGFTSRKEYWPEEEVATFKKDLIPTEDYEMDSVTFAGVLSIYPSFGGFGGRKSRNADPTDLENVRAVLKVGDRIIQPREQPGNIMSSSGTGGSVFAVPRYSYTTATATGAGGTIYGTARTYYTTYHTESYDWYEGIFWVTFDLFDDDGPRITTEDKEMEVIVIYGANERKAKYKLADLDRIFK